MEALPLADGCLHGWISVNTVYFVKDLPPASAELRTLPGSHPYNLLVCRRSETALEQ